MTVTEESDPNLMDYIEALQTGNIEKIIDMRREDRQMIRFDTADRIHRDLMHMYAKEIQVLRLECSGWKSMCEGQDALTDSDIDPQEKSRARQQIRRGLDKTERALNYRKSHSDVELPKLDKIP